MSNTRISESYVVENKKPMRENREAVAFIGQMKKALQEKYQQHGKLVELIKIQHKIDDITLDKSLIKIEENFIFFDLLLDYEQYEYGGNHVIQCIRKCVELFDDEYCLIAKYNTWGHIAGFSIHLHHDAEVVNGIKAEMSDAKEIETLESVIKKFNRTSSSIDDKINALYSLKHDILDPVLKSDSFRTNINAKYKETVYTEQLFTNFNEFINKMKHFQENKANGVDVVYPSVTELQIFFDFGLSLARLANCI